MATKPMKVRITQGFTAGEEGVAVWDPVVGKYEVSFASPWVGWYTVDQFEVID